MRGLGIGSAYMQCNDKTVDRYLSLFNPLRPDGPHVLDLSIREEHVVASMLIRMALKEPGENVVDEKFNNERYETPSSWLEDLPTQGIWSLTYQTVTLEPVQAAKHGRSDSACPDLRIGLAKKVKSACAAYALNFTLWQILGWEFNEDFTYESAVDGDHLDDDPDSAVQRVSSELYEEKNRRYSVSGVELDIDNIVNDGDENSFKNSEDSEGTECAWMSADMCDHVA